MNFQPPAWRRACGSASVEAPAPAGSLPWVRVCADAPYFETEDGAPWTPVGHNEAVDWIALGPLFRRRDPAAVERHFAHLRASGVTCLRLMLEYAQGRHRYFERPAGTAVPAMVRLWDDLFALCERHAIRILLTPFDTFWMARRFAAHPYSVAQGGPLAAMRGLLARGEARTLMKRRLEFVIRRWGGSGALFGWDLLNEIHLDLDEGRAEGLADFVHDLASHVRRLELALHGRARPCGVSVFGPHLKAKHGAALARIAFRHPDLDFATSHFYDEASIDAPSDTVAPALAVGRLTVEALSEIRDRRPFFDSEHGPIHLYGNRRRALPEAFDDEYFRHMQWAHLASGGAGGGMRWPYRRPHHRLTPGMHAAQALLADFCAEVDWRSFRRAPLAGMLRAGDADIAAFGCADERQAVLWLLRTKPLGADGRLLPPAQATPADVSIAGRRLGRYCVAALDTASGERWRLEAEAAENGVLAFRTPPFGAGLALALRLRP